MYLTQLHEQASYSGHILNYALTAVRSPVLLVCMSKNWLSEYSRKNSM